MSEHYLEFRVFYEKKSNLITKYCFLRDLHFSEIKFADTNTILIFIKLQRFTTIIYLYHWNDKNIR